MNRVMKSGLILSLLLVMGLFSSFVVSAEPNTEDYFLRVEVNEQHGQAVEISAPISLLDTLYSVMPKEIKELCKELKLKPADIVRELESMAGKDLVRVSGEDHIRVWMEPSTPENKKDLEFFKVHVKEGREKGHEIDVCLPKGLIRLAGHVISSLGLVDQFVELPDEIKNLKVVSKDE